MAYCTKDDLKTYLGITGTGEDALLGTIITRAQDILEFQTGKVFEAAADETRYFDDVDGATLYVDWICSITSIKNGDGAELAATDYVSIPRNMPPYYAIKLLSSSGTAWTGDIEVTGKFGYTNDAAGKVWGPAAAACVELAAYLYRLKDNVGDMDRPVVTDGVTILPSQWPQNVRQFIQGVQELH